MKFQRIEQNQTRLTAWITPQWRWIYWVIGLPILIPGCIGLLSSFDRVKITCDRASNQCSVTSVEYLRTQTESFGIDEVKSVRRNSRNLGLVLGDRDIRIWHNRKRSAIELDNLEQSLRQFFQSPNQPTLTVHYRDISDKLLPTAAMIILGSFLIFWMGRSKQLIVDRPNYAVILIHRLGIPLWIRKRALNTLESVTVVNERSPLDQTFPSQASSQSALNKKTSHTLNLALTNGKVIPLISFGDASTALHWAKTINEFIRNTPKPIPPESLEPPPNTPSSLSDSSLNDSSLNDSSRSSQPLVSTSTAKNMSLRLYNSLSRQKEDFTPIEPGKVRMYCCGVTVYDYCHLGHARSYIVWDVVRRYLMWRGFQVRYVQNFTDIDDKILRRAKQDGSSMDAVSERFIEAYFEDMERLNILKADDYPRATHTLDGIKRLIHELEQKGIAYAAEGDVYYSVRKFENYGKLSGRKLDEMQAGASGRVENPDLAESKKQDPFDFALWKGAKPDEPAWDSDWGKGRPGWHIECSAMVRDRFGESIDIHMGGADLVFPHHENEIAQSEAATGESLSRYWMHNGMVNVDGEKMSKSLGNFTTIRQLLDNPLPILDHQLFDPMALRLFVLQAQYRKPIDFTDEAIIAAQHSWKTLKEGMSFGWQHADTLDWEEKPNPETALPVEVLATDDHDSVKRFCAAMDDDFNTPEALAVLFELAKDLKRAGNLITHEGKADQSGDELRQQWVRLVGLAEVLGLSYRPEVSSTEGDEGGLTDEAIATLIQQRQSARSNKDFAESDRIRDELMTQGIQLIDKPGGITDWIRA